MSIFGNPVMLGGGGGGGGSANVLSGTTEPTAAQGYNGAMYLRHISPIANVSYIKMTIFATRNSGMGMQLSLVQLLDGEDTVVPWPSGTTVTSNAPSYASGETPQNLLSNTDTEYYTSTNPTVSNPSEIVFDLGTTLDFNKWRWYTANDTTERDPASFALGVSSDGESFITIDNQAITPTTNRRTIAYTSAVVVSQGAPITDTYAKVNGVWQNLIGTDINDIDLGS